MDRPSSPKPFGYHLVRISLGLVYFHFGLLKFFPDLSPAELLASQTIVRLTGVFDANEALFILAIMEVAIGIALVFNVFMKTAFVVFLFHMIGTFTPIFVLPELAFKVFPFAPTIEGQYIIKNIVFVAAGWGVLAPQLFGDSNIVRWLRSIRNRVSRRTSPALPVELMAQPTLMSAHRPASD